MLKRKWTVYIIHHSHTDIGYTDLQENIIYKQIDYIKDAVKIAKEGHKAGTVEKFFKWNCETYYCVEKFLEDASDEEKQDFTLWSDQTTSGFRHLILTLPIWWTKELLISKRKK